MCYAAPVDRRYTVLRLLTRLILAVTVGLCLGTPSAMAAPARSAAMSIPAHGGHMDDCAPTGAIAGCTSCNAILPPSPAISPVRYVAPATYAAQADDSHPQFLRKPDPPIPRLKSRTELV